MGICEVGIEEIERARQVVPITAVQNRYNLSDRRHEQVVGDGGSVLREIAESHRATPSQITLAWLLKRSPTMLPIPGTLSSEHLQENLAALHIELSEDEYQALA